MIQIPHYELRCSLQNIIASKSRGILPFGIFWDDEWLDKVSQMSEGAEKEIEKIKGCKRLLEFADEILETKPMELQISGIKDYVVDHKNLLERNKHAY